MLKPAKEKKITLRHVKLFSGWKQNLFHFHLLKCIFIETDRAVK